jgi:nitroreductase
MRLKNVKNKLRPFRDSCSSVFGHIYDLSRYLRYSGYRGYIKDAGKRDYKAVKIYHRLEKSLSFRDRKPGAGVRAAEDLVDLLSAKPDASEVGFHEGVAINVLDKYVRMSGVDLCLGDRLTNTNAPSPELGGVLDLSFSDSGPGILRDPEGFFFSRYSVRDYSEQEVSRDLVKRAVYLALKTPSACNRQAWHVYYTDVREKIDLCLSLQNGNAGFGHEIPSLMIIASDLKAFDTAGERNQGWIDGGMFSMSIIYALHSLGLSSCCLNWSKTPGDDRKIRKIIPIRSHHNIIMMLGIGYPREQIKVCASPRRHFESFFEYWA